ncbi:MAG TPA: hypothetical protein VJU61_10490, partial [Polyangiaceae bacterium]|nr:hypothetical protein [Polyangiaceae bacterium]
PQAGALFVSAECHAQWGKVLAAVQRYEAYLALEPQLSPAEHGPRLARARSGLAELKPVVPRLELVLAAPASGEVAVALDGQPLAAEQLGQPLPVEVGPHRIETRQGAGVPWRVEFALARGETRRIELEVPTDPSAPTVAAATVVPAAPEAPSAAAPAATAAAASATPVTPADSEVGSSRVRSTVGWVAGGIGAAGIIVGAAAGITVLHQKDVADEECNAQKECSDRGLEAVERGKTWGTVADVSFGVGVVGLVTGAILLLWDSSSVPSTPAVAWHPVLRAGPGGAWLGVTQDW